MSKTQIAEETLAIVSAGEYVSASGQAVSIAAAVARAQESTRLFTPAELARSASSAPADIGVDVRIEVTNESSQAAAFRLLETRDDVSLLNFASGYVPGGGFLYGASAQEEELCRCSALFGCLLATPEYYDANRDDGTAYSTDHMIHSRAVPFFRGEARELLDEPRAISIITAPAPHAGRVLAVDTDAAPRIDATMRRRIDFVLRIAADEGHRAVVLGAWGCGAFAGDPETVAHAFADALLGQHRRAFEHIVFAILVRSSRDRLNLAAFQRAFA